MASLESCAWYQLNDTILRDNFTELVKGLTPSEIADHLHSTRILSSTSYQQYTNENVDTATRNRHLLIHIINFPDGMKQLILAIAKSQHNTAWASRLWTSYKTLELELNCNSQNIPEGELTRSDYNDKNVTLSSSPLVTDGSAALSSSFSLSELSYDDDKPSFEQNVAPDLSSSSSSACLDDIIDKTLYRAQTRHPPPFHISLPHNDTRGRNDSESSTDININTLQDFRSGSTNSVLNSDPFYPNYKLTKVESPFRNNGPQASQRNAFPNLDESGPSFENQQGPKGALADLSSESEHEAYEADWEVSDGQASQAEECNENNPESLLPASMPGANIYFNEADRKRQLKLFNELSTMINAGFYREFKQESLILQRKYSQNFDILFMLQYLEASCFLWQYEFDSCEDVVKKAIPASRKTSRPSRTMVEILSSKCWMLFQEHRHQLLKEAVEDAIHIIEHNPGECTGMAAGWIYVDKARLLSAMFSVSEIHRLKRMRAEAIHCLEEALKHFQNDETKDKEFGIGFSTIMLSMILLCCGDRLQTIVFRPSEADVERARKLILQVQDSQYGIPGVLLVHVYLALCDHQMRLGISHREKAKDYAKTALDMAEDLNMAELAYYAEVRIRFLRHHFVHFAPYDSSDLGESSEERSSRPGKKVKGREKETSTEKSVTNGGRNLVSSDCTGPLGTQFKNVTIIATIEKFLSRFYMYILVAIVSCVFGSVFF